MQPSRPLDDQNTFLALIGHVCLQWALLEQGMLAIIAAAESAPLDKIYLTFAGQDMLPRIRTALNLARYHKWPQHLTKRIEAIRAELQGKSGRHGLMEKRNLVVHGVHSASLQPESVKLTSPRDQGPKRHQDVSIAEMVDLARALGALAKEAGSIFDDYGVWKFGPSGQKNSNQQRTQAESGIWLKTAENLKGAIKRLLAN